jgi:hypothetical protein
MDVLWLILGIFFLLITVFWIAQFIDLMAMPDDDFPGRFDKILWVVAFLVLFVVVAPIAFGLWKERNQQRIRARQANQPTGRPGPT